MRQLSKGRLAPAYCLSRDWREAKSRLELRMLLPNHANRALPAAPSLSLRRKKVSFQSSVHPHCIPRPSLWFSDFRMRDTSPLRLQAVLQHGAELCKKISRALHPPETKPPTHAEFPMGCELPPPAALSSSPAKHASILPPSLTRYLVLLNWAGWHAQDIKNQESKGNRSEDAVDSQHAKGSVG